MPLEKDDDFYYSFLIGLFVRESSVSKINNIKRIVDILTDDYKLTKQDILILLSNISLTDQNITTLLDKLPIIPQSSLDVLIYSLRTNIKSSPKLAITFTKVDGNNNNIILPINGINRSKPVSVSYIKNGTSIKLDNIGNNLTIDDPFSYNSDSVTVFIEGGDFTHLGYTEETVRKSKFDNSSKVSIDDPFSYNSDFGRVFIEGGDFTHLGYTEEIADNSAFFQSSKLSGISNFNSKPQSVTNLSLLFYLSTFNQDVGNWDVSGCTNMYGMFAGAINFVGTDIGAWNVSGCKNMAGMFNGASLFNGNVQDWERPADVENGIEKSTVSKVEYMNFMFFDAEKFEGTNIGAWNVSGCKDMSSMFNGALLFNGNIEGWERPANETGDIEKTTVSSVENMNNMFTFATSFNSIISNWDVSSCTTMAGMFNGATAFNNGSTGSSADGRNSLLNSEFDTTNNSVTTFTDFATGAKLIEDLGGSEITAFYNVLFINTQ